MSVCLSVCLSAFFDHFPEVRSWRNWYGRCILEKVTSGHGFVVDRFSPQLVEAINLSFLVIFRTFSISSYSFDRKWLKTHRNVLWDHTQRSHAVEFWIFALKVRYRTFKVKPGNRHLTALMTSNYHHIYMVGRYKQGQHTHVTLRSQGQSQGHQGHFRILADFTHFFLSPPSVFVGGW